MRKRGFLSYRQVVSKVAKSLCPRNFEAGLGTAKKKYPWVYDAYIAEKAL